MDNMKCVAAEAPREPNVRNFIATIEEQQSNIDGIINDVIYRLSGLEPKEGNENNSDYCLSRLDNIAVRNETILVKLRKISDCI